jgi:RHS repeat-associated protein
MFSLSSGIKLSVLGGALALGSFYCAHSLAQNTTSFEEQRKSIKAPQALASLGTDLFGDDVNLYNGALSFKQTDVSLLGNNALPVAIGRRITVGELYAGGRAFGQWEFDIPHIYGTFSQSDGWKSNTGDYNRCSNFSPPPTAFGLNYQSEWSAEEFWHGNFLYVPGVGDQRLLFRSTTNTAAPGSTSAYPIVTAGFWSISCLSTLKNASTSTQGEGFLAISPDGTKYYFDWMVKYPIPRLTKSNDAPLGVSSPTSLETSSTSGTRASSMESLATVSSMDAAETSGTSETVEAAQESDSTPVPVRASIGTETPNIVVTATLPRNDVWLLPTKVVDRFGNTVTYTYDPLKPKNLLRIDSSDGRSIVLTYIPVGNGADEVVRTVSDGSRTWTYSYAATSNLDQVVLPDNSAWNFANFYTLLNIVGYIDNGGCDGPPVFYNTALTGSIVHPSGATGTFTLTPTVHGRSYLPRSCPNASTPPFTPRTFASESLTQKTISGPGLNALVWNFDYGAVNESWDTCTTCISTKTVSVTNPASEVTRYTFGNRPYISEGRLELTEFGWNGSAMKTVANRYRAFSAGPYPDYLGYADPTSAGDAGMENRLAPLDRRITTQQDVTFTWEATQFDTFARPTQVSRYSSLGYSRSESTTYEDKLPIWVLGKVTQVAENSTGKVMVLNQYDPTTATLLSVTKFGKPQQSMTYNADGTLRTVADGKNQVTTYSNYMRGIAQRIDYPDGKNEQAVVNNIGKITSLTNEAGTTTAFSYDAIGRLYSITYPQESGLTYNTTYVLTDKMSSQEFDLAPGHWRQVVITGNAYEANFYDALWRPIYTERWDNADRANTMRRVKHRYDFAGHTVYESYPKGDAGDVSWDGSYFEYDALGRQTVRTRTSEQGNLYDGYGYYSGFVSAYVDARSNGTVYVHQAFDEPTEDAVTAIGMPEGVQVSISRDIFGKTSAITRSGNGVNATRSYVYDQFERLCKTIEPETGATIQNYDDANNVTWRATGLGLTATNNCNTGDVPGAKQIAFTYDARNRLRNMTYGDGSPAITRTYTADGLPDTVSADGTLWTYGYNNRRLPISETLNYGGVNYSIGRSYDANGSLSQLTYPDNFSVAYNPNALGEPRQAGGYATGVYYHPNGAIKQFSYGNGILHTLSQFQRGLPQVSQDGNVLKDSYAYDNNDNVTSITDQIEGVTTRGMEYDMLNRLKRVNAPALWGDAWYNYDALDNLVTSQVTGGAKARTLTHNINYGTNRLDSVTGSYTLGYQYDSQGNIIQRGGQGYSFDIGNRMRSAPGVTTHAYDGLGRRVSVVGTDGVNRIYVYCQEGKLLYATTTGQALASGTKYVYLNRHVVAEVSGNGVGYDHTDGLGSPVAQTNAGAGLVGRTRYEPYGATAAGTEPTIGFTGHLNAANLGLVDMQQRFYDPVAGRFLSIDPVTTDANTGGSFNRYAYANSSPYKYVDPDGREVVINGSEEYKRRVSADLAKISSGQRGAKWVEAAEKTPRTIQIVPSPDGKNYAQNVPSILDIFRKGSDAKIEYNPDSTTGGKDENGNRSRPAFVGLGHELGHAVAITEEHQSRDTGSQKRGTTPPSEKQSMQAENDIRADHKLPVRRNYYE